VKPPSDEDLILHYYGEAASPAEIEAALADPEVAARWQDLRRALDAVPREVAVPERGADYGEAMWRRLRRQLPERPGRRSWWSGWEPDLRWAVAAALLALLVGAFWAGGLWRERTEPTVAVGEVAVDRVLLIAVAEYLERTERLFVEVANLPASGELDLSLERQWAQRLTGAGRLYRQAAVQAGALDLAYLLQEVEPLLLELAHSGPQPSGEEAAELRDRLAREDLLFKLRIVGRRLHQETLSGARSAQS
jgi:hypothetical protein